jgi:hypothetical protein
MESKLKHLEMIQGIINRMNQCSFLLKGWGVIMISGLFALAANDANIRYVMITYIVIPVFWILDGFFIATERRYVALYDDVRELPNDKIDFDMNTSKYCNGRRTWIAGIFSKTLIPFYGVTILATVAVMCFMRG